MLEGTFIYCSIGNNEIACSPYIEIKYARNAFVSTACIHIPDQEGKKYQDMKIGNSVFLQFGYKGTDKIHTFKGSLTRKAIIGDKKLVLYISGIERNLLIEHISLSFYEETANSIAKYILNKSGLQVGKIDIPQWKIPHIIFNSQPLYQALKQMEYTLEKTWNYNLKNHCIFLDSQNILHWTKEEEDIAPLSIASGMNMIKHNMQDTFLEAGEIECVLLPGLRHNQPLFVADSTTNQVFKTITQQVVHKLTPKGNTTQVFYGKSRKWGE